MPVYDRAEQAALLNEDLFGEHDAIVHYLQHAWALQDTYGSAIESIARDEMRHLKWLAHTIVKLGGVPNLAVPAFRAPATGEALFAADIRAEEVAIRQYEEHRRVIRHPQVEGLLGRIVVDEEDHRRRFADMLNQYQKSAQPLTWAQPSSDPAGQRLEELVRLEYQQVLQSLWRSFLDRHLGALADDWEERAIDEMKHLGWIGERFWRHGRWPSFPEGDHRLVPAATAEARETTLYAEVHRWAETAAPDWVPLLERIQQREAYQRASLDQTGTGFTLGSVGAEEARR